MNDIFIPSPDIVPLYRVMPWDEPGTAYHFQTYNDAIQYGNANFGSRYDIENE